jgi:hypothetical protein
MAGLTVSFWSFARQMPLKEIEFRIKAPQWL